MLCPAHAQCGRRSSILVGMRLIRSVSQVRRDLGRRPSARSVVGALCSLSLERASRRSLERPNALE